MDKDSLILRVKKRHVVGLLFFFLSGYAYLLLGQMSERILLIIAVILFSPELIDSLKILVTTAPSIAHDFFCIMLIVAGILLNSFTPIIYTIGLILIWRLTNYCFTKKTVKIEILKLSYEINYWLCVFILIISAFIAVLRGELVFSGYEGIFNNPNAMGMLCSFFCGLNIGEYSYSIITNGEYKPQLIRVPLFLFSVICLLASTSRTSLLAFGLQLIILLAFIFIKSINGIRVKVLRAISAICIGIMGITFGILNISDAGVKVINSIIRKIQVLSGQNDITNGRVEIWKSIWDGRGLFANGESRIQPSAHSVYMALVDQFGKIPSMVYLIFMCIVLFIALKDINMKKFDWKYHMAIYIVLNFFVLSFMEVSMLTFPMIMMYVLIPYI